MVVVGMAVVGFVVVAGMAAVVGMVVVDMVVVVVLGAPLRRGGQVAATLTRRGSRGATPGSEPRQHAPPGTRSAVR